MMGGLQHRHRGQQAGLPHLFLPLLSHIPRQQQTKIPILDLCHQRFIVPVPIVPSLRRRKAADRNLRSQDPGKLISPFSVDHRDPTAVCQAGQLCINILSLSRLRHHQRADADPAARLLQRIPDPAYVIPVSMADEYCIQPVHAPAF